SLFLLVDNRGGASVPPFRWARLGLAACGTRAEQDVPMRVSARVCSSTRLRFLSLQLVYRGTRSDGRGGRKSSSYAAEAMGHTTRWRGWPASLPAWARAVCSSRARVRT